MNILLFTLEYPPFRGGVANYYGNLVKYWPPRQTPLGSAEEGQGGPPVEPLLVLHNNDNQLISPKLPMLKWLPAIFALDRTVRQSKIDQVLVGNILPLGTAAWLLEKIRGLRYSVFIHGTDLNMALSLPRKRWLARQILRKADQVICNSSFAAALCADFIGNNDKIKVVNPGVDDRPTHDTALIAALKKKYDLDGKIVLLSVGRLVRRKGMDRVLESMPLILQRVPNLAYIIVGNGPERDSLKLQINDYLLNRSAAIISDASDEERNAWYDLCDLFILAGRRIGADVEGFGIVFLEAGSAGKAVIAGDTGGVRDVVADGTNGLLIDPERPEAIAGAVIRLCTDEALRRQLGERGRERALNLFAWPKQVKLIYDIITTRKQE